MAASAPTILVVDDEPAVRGLLRRLLHSWGYEVVEAGDVDSALDVLQAQPVDAVLLDLRLPDPARRARSGLDVLGFLRLHDRFAEIPVFLVTGYGLTDAEQRFVEKHRAKVFHKPDGYSDLGAELHRLRTRPA